MLKNFYAPTWARITRHGQRNLALGVTPTTVMLFLVYLFYCIDYYGYAFFMTAFGYSLVAMAFATLVLAALSSSLWLHSFRVPSAYPLALWSYSIYLSHKAIQHALQQHLAELGWPAQATPALVALASVVTGWALYRWVAAPFMTLRDRTMQSTFAARAAAPA